MIKRIVTGIIILIIIIFAEVILFYNEDKEIIIDINELAKDIMENSKFEDELNKADNETVTNLYGIQNAVSQIVYMSSGATAEEIAIFEFKDKNESKIALEKARQRIENQKKSFEDYVPKEMQKLEEAIIMSKNKYIIVCVTDHQKDVEKILNKYIV